VLKEVKLVYRVNKELKHSKDQEGLQVLLLKRVLKADREDKDFRVSKVLRDILVLLDHL